MLVVTWGGITPSPQSELRQHPGASEIRERPHSFCSGRRSLASGAAGGGNNPVSEAGGNIHWVRLQHLLPKPRKRLRLVSSPGVQVVSPLVAGAALLTADGDSALLLCKPWRLKRKFPPACNAPVCAEASGGAAGRSRTFKIFCLFGLFCIK